MQEKMAFAFVVATFVAVVGLILIQRHVTDRVRSVEERVVDLQNAEAERSDAARRAGPAEPGPDSDRISEGGDLADALKSKDALKKLDHILEMLTDMSDEDYEFQLSTVQDLHKFKMQLEALRSMMRRVLRSGNVASNLPAKGAAIDEATRRKFKDNAERFGVRVKDGEVRVKGFLNLRPDKKMPIEFFVARYPESSHETLVHIVGNRTPEDVQADPAGALRGLVTAVYQGLLAAGFEEGHPTHPEKDARELGADEEPSWVLATGDTVYVYIEWDEEGTLHRARATDLVLDPETGTTLPQDCFRFTGSLRVEDRNTAEEMVLAEGMGLIVSVWRNAGSLVEIALDAALRNDFQYNFPRIPSDREDPSLDLVFAKEPLEPLGRGAEPPR